MRSRSAILTFAVAGSVAVLANSASGAVIFDDFNTSLGHFTVGPQSSSTTNILKTTAPHSNAVARSTDDPLEGSHSLDITIHGNGLSNASPSFARIRLLSGGANPANNTAFSVSDSGTEGMIGFFYKIPVPGTLPSGLPAGLQVQLNLDGPGGGSAAADSGIAKDAIMDGEWHFAEWNLDLPSDWVATPAIGGDGDLTPAGATTTHTIDSIYFRYPIGTTWTGYTGIRELGLDFVAMNEAGSISPLIPEPTSLAILSLGGLGLLARRRRD